MNLRKTKLKEKLLEKLEETLKAVLPVLAIVLVLCFTVAPIEPGIMLAFLLGAVLLIIGMMFFTLGADMAMTPIGENVGTGMTKTRKLWLMVALTFILGFIVTMAEPPYDKAVEVVTATVKKETHLEDIRLVEESKNWVLSPERKTSKKEREYAAKRLDGVIAKIKNAMQSAVLKIQNKLIQPEVKRAGTEQIRAKARTSVLDKLNRKKAEINEKTNLKSVAQKIHQSQEL